MSDSIKVSYSLERFTLEDVGTLEEIMDLNSDAAGTRKKDYLKFIQWNMDTPSDPYWKIVMREVSEVNEVCEIPEVYEVSEVRETMIGYIGYDDATRKPTTKFLASPGDLFLEIYLHPDFSGQGIGKLMYDESLKKLDEIKLTKYKIYASTYISNVRAQKFFKTRLMMDFVKLDKKFNVVILATTTFNQ